MTEPKKLRVLTGIKPSGAPHIGNYLGAIRPALKLAETHDSFLFIADLHALTTERDPARLREQTFEVAATWLACGLDPDEVVLYAQTDVPETTELAWLLSCFAPMGLLKRAHSYKDQTAKGATDEDISHGLFSYPVLMAADILLMDADFVPVGKDQKQHVEIAQEIARKVNNAYGEVLHLPSPKIEESVMTIPGLDGRKMSKSYNNAIPLFGTDKQTKKLIKQIKTDSTEYGQPLAPKDELVFSLYELFATDEQVVKLRTQYEAGRRDPSKQDSDFEDPTDNYFGWGNAKKELGELVVDYLGPARKEYARLMADKGHIRKLMLEGADKAREVAAATLHRVKDAAGFLT